MNRFLIVSLLFLLSFFAQGQQIYHTTTDKIREAGGKFFVTQAEKDLIRAAKTDRNWLGVWNPATNTPALTNSATSVIVGGYYTVSAEANAPFAGANFTTSTPFKVGDQIRKLNASWVWEKAALNDGIVTQAKLAAGAVTPDKTVFFAAGKNIFNKAQIFLPNSRIIDSEIQTSPEFQSKITDFIPVEPSTQYSHDSPGNRSYILYDANRGIVGFGSQWNRDGHPLTTTATTAYLRFVVFNSENTDLIQVEKGAVATAYKPFAYNLADSYLTNVLLKRDLPLDSVVRKAMLGDLKTLIHSAPGKQLFDKSKAVVGFLNGDGTVNSGGTIFRASDFIPIEAGATYSFSKNFFLYWFDAAKVVISGNQETGTNVHPVAPAGAVYARVACYASDVDAFQFEKGAVSTTYEAFVMSVPDALLTKYARIAQIPDVSGFASRTVGKNIFDKNQTFLLNSRINSNQIQTNPIFTAKVSDYIPVDPSTQYMHESEGSRNWMFFDANKVLINSGGAWYPPNNAITSPAGARFMRVEFQENDDLNRVQIEKGPKFTYYEAYRKELNVPLNQAQVIGQIPGFANKLSLPAKLYMLSGVESSVYHKALQRRWNPYTFWTRLSGNGVLNQAARSVMTLSGNTSVTANLYSADFDVIDTRTVSVVVSSTASSATAVKELAIGDSFTQPGVYLSRIKDLIPNVTFLGNRRGHPNGPASIVSEGFSGWKLDNFFTTTHNQYNDFSPFLQPSGSYRYYGNTNCWIAALAGGTNSTYYATAQRVGGFNATTGYKTNPSVNDVMWVDGASRYEVYNGSAWVEISESALNFSFNFAKYLQVWGIDTPTHVSLMLGVNDMPANWRTVGPVLSQFKSQLDQVIASVKSVSSSIKFAVVLPCNNFGGIDNQNDVFTPARNASMFELREMLIANYDSRESQGIYVVDFSSAMDDQYGSHLDSQLPFPEYVTEPGYNEEKRKLVRDAIHPDNAYRQGATPLAGWIQATRNDVADWQTAVLLLILLGGAAGSSRQKTYAVRHRKPGQARSRLGKTPISTLAG